MDKETDLSFYHLYLIKMSFDKLFRKAIKSKYVDCNGLKNYFSSLCRYCQIGDSFVDDAHNDWKVISYDHNLDLFIVKYLSESMYHLIGYVLSNDHQLYISYAGAYKHFLSSDIVKERRNKVQLFAQQVSGMLSHKIPSELSNIIKSFIF